MELVAFCVVIVITCCFFRFFMETGTKKNSKSFLLPLARITSDFIMLGDSAVNDRQVLIREFLLKLEYTGSDLGKAYSTFMNELGVPHARKPELQYEDVKFVRSYPYEIRYLFIRLLFKLAVSNDGIYRDEWDALNNMMVSIRLSEETIEQLIEEYKPLAPNRAKKKTYSKTAWKKRTKQQRDQQRAQQSEEHKKTAGGGGKAVVQQKVDLAAFFRVLDLPASASPAEVQVAYRRLALQHHPDLPKNADRQEECVALMAKINTAYRAIANSFN